jgi:8-oxo-dGTP pyrophosphatase MutT (NUDIX family)
MRFNPKGDDTRPTIEDYPYTELHDSYRRSRYDWNPNDHDDSILRITKSSLGTFNWCKMQYWLQYFAGLRGETVYYHTRGLNVHDAVEYFWDNIVPQEVDIRKALDSGNREQARAIMHDIIPHPPEPYEYGEEEQIRQWVDWQFERFEYTDGYDWIPVDVEANIHATRIVEVDDTPIPVHLRGYIDTIFLNDTGDGYALMELKTGKWKSRSKTTAMRKEMQFYRMMLEHSPHHEYLPITHWGWEFPGGNIEGGEGTHIFYEPVKKARLIPSSVEKSIERLVRAHVENDFPTPTAKEVRLGYSGSKCDYCAFVEQCPRFTGVPYEVEK